MADLNPNILTLTLVVKELKHSKPIAVCQIRSKSKIQLKAIYKIFTLNSKQKLGWK